MSYLPKGLPEPVTETDKLDLPYWQGTRAGKLMVQRCGACQTWQWGPEWLCHHCLSWDMKWVRGRGTGQDLDLDPVLASGAFGAEGRRALYRRAGRTAPRRQHPHARQSPRRPASTVTIGAPVTAVFEPHDDAKTPYTLVQWQLA